VRITDEKLSGNIKILYSALLSEQASSIFQQSQPQNFYDYTFRVAENLLHGRIGFTEPQPSWLNEFVPFENYYYSVFPLGSVLTMLPFAILKGCRNNFTDARRSNRRTYGKRYLFVLVFNRRAIRIFLARTHFAFDGDFVRFVDVDESGDDWRLASSARIRDARRTGRDIFYGF
jgi:hypothetical protein